MALDHLALATTPVVALKGDRPSWQGSGVFYVHETGDEQVLYLVTNQHVLTGLPPGDASDPLADQIVFHLHLSEDKPGDVRPVRVPLRTRTGLPVWFGSDAHPRADVAAIPIPTHVCEGCHICCLNAEWGRHAPRTKLSPGRNVQVVGFPYGYHDRENSLPLWQSGILASEPTVDVNGEPHMIIDLPAYPGMSGAPVFTTIASAGGGAGRLFLGIYATLPVAEDGAYPEAFCTTGRPGIAARDAAHWGHVWRAEFLEELLGAADTERWQREVLPELG